MMHDEIITYCLTKPGAYVDYPFGPNFTILKVKGRIFTQCFCLHGEPVATFNCNQPVGEFYRSLYPAAVTRGYHCPPIQQPYFNTVQLAGGVPEEEILNMIDHAYKRVTGKLTVTEREELQPPKL